MPKVSVIIPVYNVERYLSRCVRSVMAQTIRDLEIICVDDGSTDSSSVILKKLAREDKRIKIISKPNAGYGHTVNTGICNSSGEFIGIVDSDDYISPDMYETLYRIAVQEKADIVRSDFFEIRKSGKHLQKKRVAGFDDVSVYNRQLDPKKDKACFFYRTMNIWTGIYNAEFINSHKIRLNETPGASFQDCGFWFQTMTQADKVIFSDKAFYHYRRDNPNSSVNDKNKVYNIFEEYGFIRAFLDDNEDIYKAFFHVYVSQKYYAYNDLYLRILNKDRLNFLTRAGKEFLSDLKELGDKVSEIDPFVVGEITRIADSPVIYFYESSVDRMNMRKMDMDDKLNALRNTLEYRIAFKIKRLEKLIRGVLKKHS